MNLRIALSGAGGSGKGTLGTLLSKYYGLPLLGSPSEGIGRDLEMKTYKDAEILLGQVFQHACLYAILYQEKGCLAGNSGFISERSSLDCIPYYLDRQLPKLTRYEAIAMDHAKEYDHVFYLPADFAPSDVATAKWKERNELARARTDNFLWSLVQASVLPQNRTRLAGSKEQRFAQACSVIDGLLAPHTHSLAPAS